MKEKLLYVLGILTCAGLWLKLQTNPHSAHVAFADSVQNADAVLLKDRAKLEQNLKKETVQDENWAKINDYSIPVPELVTGHNSHAFFKVANSSVRDLNSCLKKDFCGMERRNDDDAYFDDTKTPGHILLGRELEIMLTALKKDPGMKSDIDWDVIRELTDSANEKIQVLAVQLLSDYGPAMETEKLIKIADDYRGDAKAQALEKLSAKVNELDRPYIISTIEKSFAVDDPHTVISVVERLQNMNLNQTEKDKVARNLCRFKENGNDDPNWKMIRYDMKKAGSDLDVVCN